jgi:hypothetical protein
MGRAGCADGDTFDAGADIVEVALGWAIATLLLLLNTSAASHAPPGRAAPTTPGAETLNPQRQRRA